MKNYLLSLPLVLATILLASCEGKISEAVSETHITNVAHTSSKRQSIGNCWLYAQATWLESLILSSDNTKVNVSETYWTYWFFFEMLQKKPTLGEDEELATGGSWPVSSRIIQKYGWVEEKDFLPNSEASDMSIAQMCAEDYLTKALRNPNHILRNPNLTDNQIKDELHKAFSCDGASQDVRDHAYLVGMPWVSHFELPNMDELKTQAKAAKETRIKDAKTGETSNLAELLYDWQSLGMPRVSQFEGKKLPSTTSMVEYRKIEQKIKRALNDNVPVVLAFFVSFEAPDKDGIFNLNTLAKAGHLGSTGGHMVIGKDYTAMNVPDVDFNRLGESNNGVDFSAELKEKAYQADTDYIVIKNSWGTNRSDRPWITDGTSRLSWDYLTKTYYDEKDGVFYPFLRGMVLPSAYR
ncbi:MAG: hypothetical protein EOP10_00055 [Proteobacteria bacterium]|nr:MAG: hypothetical protein EOP10_00055 [Pseudomonadota bacterium]